MTYFPELATRRIIVVEATPSLTETGWTVHSGDAYKVTLSPWYNGLYRRVTGVRQNLVALTEVASIATVISTEGSWFWDEANELLYVRAGKTDFLPLNQTSRLWWAMCASPNGDVYASDLITDLYMQSGGEGQFVSLGSQVGSYCTGMAAAPNGNIYACTQSPGTRQIYMRTGGTGNFASLAQTNRDYEAMCAAPNGDVYVCVYGGDIYKQTGGTGNFIALGGTSRNWKGMAADASGNIYACVWGGDIYVQTGGVGSFTGLGETSRAWTQMTVAPNGDVYATVNLNASSASNQIYVRTGGTGSFTSRSQEAIPWHGIAAAPDGSVYSGIAAGSGSTIRGDIYKQYNDPINSTMQALVTYYFATEGAVINRLAADPSSGIYYEPWVIGRLPNITRELADLVYGITGVSSATVSFTNGHGLWNALIPDHNWKNKKVAILSAEFEDGAAVPDRPDFTALVTMQVNDIAADDVSATVSLVGIEKGIEKRIPSTILTPEFYPNIGNGVAGGAKWLGWGRATILPDLTDTSSYGVYTVADAAYQTLYAVNSVVAIAKSGGARTTLTLTTHYTVDLTKCTITIVSATYTHASYTIECDVTGKPDGGGSYLKTFSAIVKDILQTHLGVSSSDLDTSSFTSAASSAPQELAVWIKDPRSIASIFSSSEPKTPSLGKSVFGTVRLTGAGKWSVLIDGDVTGSGVVLDQGDFVAFHPEPRIESSVSGAVVFYAHNHSLDSWASRSGVDNEFKFLTDAYETSEIYTYLKDADDAEALLNLALPKLTTKVLEVEFELRGAALEAELAGDTVTVSYSPAPVSGGTLVSEALQIQRLDISISPTLKISGRFKQPV